MIRLLRVAWSYSKGFTITTAPAAPPASTHDLPAEFLLAAIPAQRNADGPGQPGLRGGDSQESPP
ncbi:MAG: hypothetical protein WCP35_06135 [Verrucomicrobiota bacterium]